MLLLRSKIVNRDALDVSVWNDFVLASPQRIIYAESFYLDAVFENWQAILCYHDKKLMAIMPICLKKISFIKGVTQPSWTQYLGILFCLENEKSHRHYFLQKKIIESIFLCLPKRLQFFNVNFSPTFKYFVPFYWLNFKVTPYHSFQLSLQKSKQEIFDNFSSSVTNCLNKSEHLNLRVIENNSVDYLSQILLTRIIIKESEQLSLIKLWESLKIRKKCFTIYVTDAENSNIYCGGAFVIDHDRIIFLASALDYAYRKSGAATLLIWAAIQKALEMEEIKYFDFEGSMIESIENYFRGFGAQSIVYYNIQRTNLAYSALRKINDLLFKQLAVKGLE